MAAQGGGGRAASKRAKDTAMSAYLKKHNVDRREARCPICNKMVACNRDHGGMAHHVSYHR